MKGAVDAKSNYDYSDDVLTAEFRHKIGILADEEEGLSEAFKSKLGLHKGGQQNNQITEIIMMSEIEKEATLSKFKFDNFIKRSCNILTDSIFYKDPLVQPLMPYLSVGLLENMSAVLISHAIKQFCGDIASKNTTYQTQTPIIRVVLNNLDKRILASKSSSEDSPKNKRTSKMNIFGPKPRTSSSGSDQDVLLTVSNTNQKPQKRLIKDKLLRPLSSQGNNFSGTGNPTLDTLLATIPIEPLQLAQFIIFYGIIKDEFRDEIFCQLCCQVSQNPNPESARKAWVLHVLCAGCFTPSNKLMKFYFSFLNDAPSDFKEYAQQTKRLVHRTNSFGVRFHPSTSLEFLAVCSRKHILLPVMLADGNQVSVEVDSATSASEMCHKIAACIGLKDQFGFSLYINMEKKVSSLGNGNDHVLDAIAECEHLNRSQGLSEYDADWKLFYAKEIFTPWHDPELDDRCTELIYWQICKSVVSEEFKFKTDQELVSFVARRWYIDYGTEMEVDDLKRRLHEFIPTTSLESSNATDLLAVIVHSTFEKMRSMRRKYTRLQLKRTMVSLAQKKWPLQFAALFESEQVGGPSLAVPNAVVAISCQGVSFLRDDPFVIMRSLHFYEIIDVTYVKGNSEDKQAFEISTVKGDKWKFISYNADSITKLLSAFLDGLRRRSLWAVCIQHFVLQDHSEGNNFLLQQGDVIQLMEESNQKNIKEDWMHGKNERTGKIGSFPFDCIYIFPTNQKPPASYLNIFNSMSKAFVSTLPRKRGAVVLSRESNAHVLHSAA